MIPEKLKEKVIHVLTTKIDKKVDLLDFKILTGGCINNSCKIIANCGSFFLKWNQDAPNRMFETEKRGLELLRQTQTIYIPDVIEWDKNFLLMEFIDESHQTNNFWEEFGFKLSNLHRESTISFGLDYNNFIGSLPQDNTIHSNWLDFFISQRIRPQLAIGDFSSNFLSSFDRFFTKIDNLFPNGNSSLLHGDLWSGNFLIYEDSPVLIDPAIYFGFREMDIAMSQLFGGFDNRFYSSYNENYPLDAGWKDRLDICNLYPLLVHVNLFGGSYYDQTKNIINRFI